MITGTVATMKAYLSQNPNLYEALNVLDELNERLEITLQQQKMITNHIWNISEPEEYHRDNTWEEIPEEEEEEEDQVDVIAAAISKTFNTIAHGLERIAKGF
jgi:sugar-specific transcriptional regulator TrmB